MYVELKRRWQVRDGSLPFDAPMVFIEPGKHEFERIPNPYGKGEDWLVLAGTKKGMKESAWRQWNSSHLDEFHVVITGDRA